MKIRYLILTVILFAAQSLPAAIFMKLDGVPGESKDDEHKDEIEILSYSWGLSQTAVVGGGGAGRASFQDFNFSKELDKASPQLMLKCANGAHIKEAIITVRKDGEKPQEYLVIKLTDILVSSYQSAGSAGGGIPSDQFSLNYAKIEFKYYPLKPDGTPDSPITTTWDVKANTP